jgi:hypothetical protein
MLINCPRCGFSQPQDQYCAQCGVDMQRYKPKEQPLLTQIFGNTAFQIIALLIATFFVGQYILTKPAPRKFVQRMIYPVSKSESVRVAEEETAQSERSQASSDSDDLSSTAGAALNRESLSGGEAATGTQGTQAGVAAAKNINDPNLHTLKLTYAEVPVETLNRWITLSNSAGLYQSLTDYSVGILTDFKKVTDKYQSLKSTEMHLPLNLSNANWEGVMNDDGSQLIGMTVNVEIKSADNETLLGSINVNKSGSQGAEAYPSEFELPKGSAFFLVGALKVENFQSDRTKLTMPPFQIFKSQDFMTRKTEFVIILEPVYK